MHFRSAGANGPRPEFDLWRVVAAFPGPIAAAAVGPWHDTVPLVEVAMTNDEPWTVKLYYPDQHRPGLAVQTVRSLAGLNGLRQPVESLTSAMLNYLINNVEAPPRPVTAADAAAHRDAVVGRRRRIEAQLADSESPGIAIRIDDHEHPGERIGVPGYTGIKVPWVDQTVYCMGTDDEIASLALRTALPEELERWANGSWR